jgi:Leucine-rich repeat (LRR) protein
LPSWIGELKSMEELDLHENQLKDLPDELKYAAQLKVLQLEQNQFTVFPKVLVEVPALESVILGRNKITTVPDLNPSPSGLKYISLRLNKLEAFPWTLAALPKTKFDFEGNPFVKAAGYKIDNVIAAVSGAAHSPATRNTLLALAMGTLKSESRLP